MSRIKGTDSLAELTHSRSAQRRGLLINAVTELFATEVQHSAEERLQFEELISQLLVYAGTDDKQYVATKLCQHPDAPALLIAQLGQDEIAVAEPVLRQSQQLDDAALIKIVNTASDAHRQIVAQRKWLNPDVVRALIEIGNKECLRLVITNEDAKFDARAFAAALRAADAHPELTKLLSQRADMNPKQLAKKFNELKTDERERVIAGFKAFPEPEDTGETYLQLSETAKDIVASLEQLATRKQIKTFAQVMAAMIRLPQDAIVKMIGDESGEPLIVMLKAVGVKEKSALRILLHINEKIGESVASIYRLISIYRDMPQSTANAILRELRITAKVASADTSESQKRMASPVALESPARPDPRKSVPKTTTSPGNLPPAPAPAVSTGLSK